MHETSIYTARLTDVVVEDVGDELLVYDRRSDVAHCLSNAAAIAWRACERGASLSDVAERLEGSGAAGVAASETAERALLELVESGLLEEAGSSGIRVSRRHALRRIAGGVGVAVTAPLIVSAAVPTSAAALSSTCATTNAHCSADTQCCSDSCTAGKCDCIPNGNGKGFCTQDSDCCTGGSCNKSSGKCTA